MPNLEDVYEWNPDAGHSCRLGPFARLSIAFGTFGERYCSLDVTLPLVGYAISVAHYPSTTYHPRSKIYRERQFI